MSDVERSKYLGGDAEHTHLVKGLDYALLERVKADIARKEREEEEERKRREEVLEFETTKPKAEKVVTDSGIAVDAPRTFKSHVGKALYTTLFLKHRYRVALYSFSRLSENLLSSISFREECPSCMSWTWSLIKIYPPLFTGLRMYVALADIVLILSSPSLLVGI